MPPPPKDPDKIPKPRASRVKSGKPPAPPTETAAGTPEVRARWAGDDVSEGFIRLSAGCEDTADLVSDVARALDMAGVQTRA